MKLYSAAFMLSLALVGCQDTVDAEKTKKGEAKEVTNTSTTTGDSAETSKSSIADKDKMAYGLGASMATNIGGLNERFKSLDMNMEMVKQGFADQIAKQSKMTDEEALQQAQIFSQKLQFAQQQEAQKAQAEMIAANEKFIKESIEKGYTATESGLLYKQVEPAKDGAATPSPTDTVKVHYTGTFTDGTKFDSSRDKGQPFTFSLKGGVIQGWLEGVKLMQVGSKYQFVIPPELGYGFQPRQGMPGGSILLFDIELLEIVEPEVIEEKAAE